MNILLDLMVMGVTMIGAAIFLFLASTVLQTVFRSTSEKDDFEDNVPKNSMTYQETKEGKQHESRTGNIEQINQNSSRF
jgi:hypothetical protein